MSTVRREIAEFLASQELPYKYTAATLVLALDLDPASEFKRRHRELREHGWVIQTYRENADLGKKEYLLTEVGEMP